MTGLEKIIQSIDEIGQTAAAEILRQAQAETAEIQSRSDQAVQRYEQAEAQKLAEDVARMSESGRVAVMAESRREILGFKGRKIGEVLDALQAHLVNLPTEENFSLLLSLIEKNAGEGACVLHFSQKDQERLPEDFEKQIHARCPAFSFEIGKAADISGGVILQYGDIEQNCSFEAIIEENADQLKDIISETLFS